MASQKFKYIQNLMYTYPYVSITKQEFRDYQINRINGRGKIKYYDIYFYYTNLGKSDDFIRETWEFHYNKKHNKCITAYDYEYRENEEQRKDSIVSDRFYINKFNKKI